VNLTLMATRFDPIRSRRHADAASVLFLLAVLTNTALIAVMPHAWLAALLSLPQALLLVGCQEAKHLCVHGTFVTHRAVNNMIGIVCAALFGANFVAYRYFHFAHHRAACTDTDPEGRLYALSWSTRWIWLLAPVELPWVAWHIGRVGWSMVPRSSRAQRNAAAVWMAAFAALVAVGLRHAPQTVVFGYLLPLVLFSWFDFMLTQAEHYGVAIVPASSWRDPASLTHDIVLPFGLGWLTLHRALHRVHHHEPGLRWVEAPRRLRADPTARPLAYGAFARCWLADGPRLWLNAQGTPAAANLPPRA